VTRGGRRQARTMFCHLSWGMGVNARLLSHKNGPAGLLMVVEKVKARMAGTVDDLVLTLR
jgi:hypothetical protein